MRPRSFHLLPLLLAAALLGAAAPADDLLEPTPTTKDSISIQLPKTWKPRQHESTHTLLVAGPANADTDTTGDYVPVIIVRCTPYNGSPGSINGDAQQAHIAGEMNNYQITEKPQQLSINGLDAITFGGTFTQGALKLRSRQYLIVANDHLYTLTLISLVSTWDQHLPAFDAAIHTFALAPKTN